MKDTVNLKTMKPFGAEGRVCINYTDPVTGKIKEQIKGTNHVFADQWFQLINWWEMLASVRLVLTDSTRAVDTNFPYLLGNPIGYGVVNGLGEGTYKGAYNTTYSFLQAASPEGVSSKLAFDFTPTQVPTAVKSIGLTEQYDNPRRQFFKKKKLENWGYGTPSTGGAADSEHFYSIAAGIVTKRNLMSRIATTIDISAIVGTTNLRIGCDQTTGRLYVRKFDGTTAGNRRMYEFSDGTFGTLLNTYTTTNDTRTENFYVYAGCAYAFVDYRTVVKSNFAGNAAPVTYVCDTSDIMGIGVSPNFSSVGCSGKYLAHSATDARYTQQGFLFDMATDTQAGRIGLWGAFRWYNGYGGSPLIGNANGTLVEHPYDAYVGSANHHCAAIALAAYKLPVDAPDRPAGYGMTVTYEVQVYL